MKPASKKQVFQPYRSIGYISNSVPLSIQSKGQTWFLTAAVGSNWMLYEASSMKLLLVGATENNRDIQCIKSFQDYTLAGAGNDLKVYKRQELVSMKPFQNEIQEIALIGPLIFLAFVDAIEILHFNYEKVSGGTEGNCLLEPFNVLSPGNGFYISAMLHPSTYVNKVLISSNDGRLQLWNYGSMTLIYEFKKFTSPISNLVQSPSIDVIAIGLLDGTIILHNIKLDREIMRFQQSGRVTAITFRTDGNPVMASSNPTGQIALWNLSEKRLLHIMMSAHEDLIHSCCFFHGLPILISAGSDNSIKQWIFDSNDGSSRLLKSRGGHFKPPTRVRYYGQGEHAGYSLLTSGQDSTLRFFNAVRDSQNVELSQGRLAHRANKLNVDMNSLRVSPIVGFDANDSKQSEWDNIISCHAGEATARTWSIDKKKIGAHTLPSKDGSVIKSVCVSCCGNFGFLGSAKGQIDKYNMQSGLYRGSFKDGHSKAVTGLVSDSINSVVISASIDCDLKIWDFAKYVIKGCIKFAVSISSIELHNDSRLLAVVCDDLVIRVVDIDSFKIVREFKGHRNRITDVAFSFDGRRLISASLDTTIRTWDLPTGFMIDCFCVEAICTSLALSPTNEFLATTHVDKVGVYLWSNASVYGHVSFKKIDESYVDDLLLNRLSVDLPLIAAENLFNGDEENPKFENVSVVPDKDQEERSSTFECVQDGLISISSLPKSKWQNLLHLDSIKERNKPKEAPKAPEKAPFLLPTLAGTVPSFIPSLETEGEVSDFSRILNPSVMADYDTVLIQLLRKGTEEDNYEPVFAHLKQLGPSAVDFEIRSLPFDVELIENFLKGIHYRVQSGQDFELGMVYLNVLLKVHGDLVREADSKLVDSMKELSRKYWDRLESKLLYGMCLVEFSMHY